MHIYRPSTTLTTKQFIERAVAFHGDRYDYSQVDYVNGTTKVTLICLEHGPWDCLPTNHIGPPKSGCPECGKTKRWSNRTDRITTEEFIARAKEIHGDNYDYTGVVYNRPWDPLLVTCNDHGPFESNYLLIKGVGCPKCAHVRASATKVARGIAIAPEDRSEYELFIHNVTRVTEQNYRKFKHIINPDGHKRSIKGWHLDHIYSKQQAFNEGIPPEVIGHYTNLRILSGYDNRVKYMRCDVTKEELYERYNAAVHNQT